METMNSWTVQGKSVMQPQQTLPSSSLKTEIASERKPKKQQQQPRQLLSCTKCRERKVKCDRTKPCSACCARGLPKECHFVLGEGAEFGPIQQSLELRRLRAENQRLKERILADKTSYSEDSEIEEGSSGARAISNGRRPSHQRRFRANDQTDSLYFGSPGLASVIADFANLQVEPKSLSHAMPRGADMYAAQDSMYPFPTLWPAMSRTEGLLQCLPPREQLFIYLESFSHKAQCFAFPYIPEELTIKEVEHFLKNVEENAEKVPDLLGLIFAALALGVQLGTFEGRRGSQTDTSQPDSKKGEVFSVAAMQALRLSNFTSRPTLKSIQAMVMLAPYLTNSGRFLDAWSISGLTIRLAHSIGLHRNPRFLDPAPSLRESTVRKTLWWWLLHMDQEYSMTLGRPLGISGIGDCPPPDPLTTDPVALRLCEFFDQLTIVGRQILSSSQLTDSRIDMYTDRLIALWDTMPDSLQFNSSWIRQDTEIPEWPMDVRAAISFCSIHNYIILLNRQRIENNRNSPDYRPPSPRPRQFSTAPELFLHPPSSSHDSSPSPGVPRGRSIVIDSCLALIDAFVFFYERVPSALVDWTIGQQAFNACMILLLDAIEVGSLDHIERVEMAYLIFVEMDKTDMHQLTGLAMSRIAEGLTQLRQMEEKAKSEAISSSPTGRKTLPNGRHTISPTGNDNSYDWDMDPKATTNRTHEFLHDSVMGATGMFLLEDPGLQTSTTPGIKAAEMTKPRDFVRKQSVVAPCAKTSGLGEGSMTTHLTPVNPRRDSAHPLSHTMSAGVDNESQHYKHIQHQQQQQHLHHAQTHAHHQHFQYPTEAHPAPDSAWRNVIQYRQYPQHAYPHPQPPPLQSREGYHAAAFQEQQRHAQ